MRDYGRVYSAFWQSPEVRAMGEDARTLALYLLTSPHGNLIGCFRLPDAYAADDLQWPSARVAEGFAELQRVGFVDRDDASKWVRIAKYLKWNNFESPNVAKAAHKAFDQVPSLALKRELAKCLLECGVHLSEAFGKACRSLPQPFANPEPTRTIPEPEPEPEPSRSLNRNQPQPVSDGVADAPPAEPKKPRAVRKHGEPPPSAETWAAYSGAYEARYSAAPVRNAKVNAQIAQFVGRIGAEEAPAVARFYCGHQGQFYVRQMHSTDMLLHDAEKLRTEWATGRQSTNAGAVLADRTQTNFQAFAPMIEEARRREEREAQDAQQDVA